MAAHRALRLGKAGRHENRPGLYLDLPVGPPNPGLDARTRLPIVEPREQAEMSALRIAAGGGYVRAASPSEASDCFVSALRNL